MDARFDGAIGLRTRFGGTDRFRARPDEPVGARGPAISVVSLP